MNIDEATVSVGQDGWRLTLWPQWWEDGIVIGPFRFWADLRDAFLGEYGIKLEDMCLADWTTPEEVLEWAENNKKVALNQDLPLFSGLAD